MTEPAPLIFDTLTAHCNDLAELLADLNYDDMSSTQVAACSLALRKMREVAMLCEAIAAEYRAS